jgi:hypothetical protein
MSRRTDEEDDEVDESGNDRKNTITSTFTKRQAVITDIEVLVLKWTCIIFRSPPTSSGGSEEYERATSRAALVLIDFSNSVDKRRSPVRAESTKIWSIIQCLLNTSKRID